jgi:hypothetical protein
MKGAPKLAARESQMYHLSCIQDIVKCPSQTMVAMDRILKDAHKFKEVKKTSGLALASF